MASSWVSLHRGQLCDGMRRGFERCWLCEWGEDAGVLFLRLSTCSYLWTWVQLQREKQGSVPCSVLFFLKKAHLAQIYLLKFFNMAIFSTDPINMFSDKTFWYKKDLKLPSKGNFPLMWSRNFCLLLIFIEPHTGKSRWTFQVSCSLPLLLWLSFLLSWSLCNPTPVSKVFVLLFCSWARLPFSYLPTFHSQDSDCIFLCLHAIVYKYIHKEMHLRNVWKCSFMF